MQVLFITFYFVYICNILNKKGMKKINQILVMLVVILFIGNNVSAQKIRVVSGSLKEIVKEKNINLAFDYSNFGVGKYKTEEEYVKYKMEDAEKREPGSGEKWKMGWESARKSRYEPKFEELINKGLEKKGITVVASPEAKYTLTVKTTFVEPGFNVGVMKKPAYVNFEYIFTETGNPENVVAKLKQDNVPGSQFGGADFDVGSRVAESYAKGGKMLAKYMNE